MKLKRAMYELIVTENVNLNTDFSHSVQLIERNKRPVNLFVKCHTNTMVQKLNSVSVDLNPVSSHSDHITTKSRGIEKSSSLKELCTKLVKLWKVYIPCNSSKSNIFLRPISLIYTKFVSCNIFLASFENNEIREQLYKNTGNSTDILNIYNN